MTDEERVEELTATLRLLFQATSNEDVIERALRNVVPNWGIMRPRTRTKFEELLADMEKSPIMDPRELSIRLYGR